MKNILYGERIYLVTVLLVILFLWIPNISFADEQTDLEIRVAEKVEQLQNIQRINTTLEQAAATVAAEESEPWLVTKIYAWGVFVFGIVAILFCIVAFVSTIHTSIRFNYHLYVEYGEFAWTKADTGAREDIRTEIAEKLKLPKNDITDYAWFPSLWMPALATVIVMIGVIAWPAVAVTAGPQGLIALLAWRKRKKRVFEKKLKGETVGPV